MGPEAQELSATPKLTGWALEAQQLKALLLRKALLQKRRGLGQSLTEILSPILIM